MRADLKHTNLFLFAIVRGHASCYLHVKDMLFWKEGTAFLTSSFLHFRSIFFSSCRARGSESHQNVLWSISYSHVVREQVKSKKPGVFPKQRQNTSKHKHNHQTRTRRRHLEISVFLELMPSTLEALTVIKSY